MPISMEDVDLRFLSRMISCADFLLSFAGTVGTLVMAILQTQWNWDHLSSCSTSGILNATIGTNSSGTTPAQPKAGSTSTVLDVKSMEDLLVQWLFYIVISLICLVRASAAFALYKATEKEINHHKVTKHCGYWAVVAITSTIFLGWIIYQRYAGTFSQVIPISAADFYCYWLVVLYQIGGVGIVAAFVFKLVH